MNREVYRDEPRRRLRILRDHLGIAQSEFAKKLGIANSYLSELESGRKNMTYNVFMRLIEVFHVHPNWFLLGTGHMLLAGSETNDDVVLGNCQLESIDKDLPRVMWYLKHSPIVKHTVIGFALKFLHDNESIIKNDIEVNRSIKKTDPSKGGNRK